MSEIKINELSFEERAKLFNKELVDAIKPLTEKYQVNLGTTFQFIDITTKVEEAQVKEVIK